jgi:aspartate/methionine/tyrosine aminotransferase
MEKARQIPDLIHMSLCDPPRYGFSTTIDMIHIVGKITQLRGYPDLHDDLREVILTRLKQFTGITGQNDNVLITSGLSTAISLLSQAFHSQQVGLQTPVYLPIYEYFRRTTEIFYIRTKPTPEWRYDFDQVRSKLEGMNNPSAIFLVTPSNPTGHTFNEQEVKELIDIAGEFNLIVMSDEVYDEMTIGEYYSLLTYSKDVPVVYLNGLSKVYRAPEVRLGYTILHDPDEKAVDQFNEIKRVFSLSYGVSPISQRLAIEIMKEDPSERKGQLDEIVRRRHVLQNALESSKNLQVTLGDGATYFMVKTPWNDWKVAEELLKKHKMLIIPGSVYDNEIGENFIRVVYLHQDKVLEDFVQKLDGLF